MEKITISKRTSPLLNSPKMAKKTFNVQIDQFLLEKGKNFIKSQQLGGHYQFNSFTDLIKVSLTQFQNKQLSLVGDRNLTNPRQVTTFCLPTDLAEFYLSLPAGQRVGILERCLSSFLQQLASG